MEKKAIRANLIFQTSYDEMTGLGKAIRQRQLHLQKSKIDKRELTVLIKPSNTASYQNVVNALDEMLINGVTRYAILDLSAEEMAFIDRVPN